MADLAEVPLNAVIGFSLMDGSKFNTNWQLKSSFPLFLYNTLRALGNARESSGNETHLPDMPVLIRADSQATTVDVYGHIRAAGVAPELLDLTPELTPEPGVRGTHADPS